MADQKAPTKSALTTRVAPLAGWFGPVAGLIVYANTLPNGFVYDDVPVIQRNARLQEVGRWREIWTGDYWLPPQGLEDPQRDLLYRPLTLQSYALNHLLFGDGAWHFHLVNVLIFAAVCGCVWRLGIMLFGQRSAALIAALLFAVHPIHTEAVAGIVGRAELLCTLLMLAALLLWHQDRLRPSAAAASAASLAFLAALLCKETALTLPLVALVVDAWWRLKQTVRPAGYWRARLLRCYLPLATALGVYAAMRAQACGRVFASGVITALQNPLVDAGLIERLVTPFKLLGLYLWLFLWPDRLCADYSLAALLPDRSFNDPLALLGLLAIPVAAILAWRSVKGDGAAACTIGIFAAAYAIIANGPVLIGTIFAERLLFWPSVPLCLLAGLGIARARKRLCARPDFNPRIIDLAVGLLLLGLGLRAGLRNRDWSGNDTLFAAAMEVNPRSAKVLHGYANVLLDAGQARQASQLLERAVTIWPGHRDMWFLLGLAYRAQGRLDDTLQALHAAELLRVPSRRLQLLISNTRLARQGKPDLRALLTQAEAQVRADPDHARARYRLGTLLLDAGRSCEAIEHLQAAYQAGVDPDQVRLHLADALYRCGQYADAAERLRRQVTRTPDAWRAHALLARSLTHLPGGKTQAVRHARRAVALAPDQLQARIALAEVLADVGRPTEAIEAYESVARRLTDDRPRRVIRFQIARLAKDRAPGRSR